ncbi:MAG: hypothetical protein ACOCVF_03105 [bacterium]
MKSKDLIFWELALNILNTCGERLDSMDLIFYSGWDNENIKIYHKNGHCFEITKEYCCEPEEIDQFDNVDKDGYIYIFREPWEDYTRIGIDKAIQLLRN